MNSYFVTVSTGPGHNPTIKEVHILASSYRVAVKRLVDFNISLEVIEGMVSVRFDMVNEGKAIEITKPKWQEDFRYHNEVAEYERLHATDRHYIMATAPMPEGYQQYHRRSFERTRRIKQAA